MQRTEFKVSGLGRGRKITCETDKENIFWPKVNMTQERFDALWNYWVSGGHPMSMIAEIEHDGFYDDGTPRKATVVSVYD